MKNKLRTQEERQMDRWTDEHKLSIYLYIQVRALLFVLVKRLKKKVKTIPKLSRHFLTQFRVRNAERWAEKQWDFKKRVFSPIISGTLRLCVSQYEPECVSCAISRTLNNAFD